jgi:hypothetical protein
MADIVTLTHQPIRYTTAAGAGMQPILMATDVGGYDFLDLEGGVVANEGSVSAFTLDIYTGMQAQTDDGWIQVGSSLITAATTNTWYKQNYASGLLRYVRWRVTTITSGTAITFFIRGMARRYA